MEKVTVRIGIIGCKSAEWHNTKIPSERDSIDWLRSAFGISHNRAHSIYNKLKTDAKDDKYGYLELILNYEQLARYTAKRATEGLINVWKYPQVLEHEEHEEPEAIRPPIELRPGVRPVP